MSYDKINYRKLKSAFNSIDNINCNKITNLKNDISKSDWGKARNNHKVLVKNIQIWKKK